MKNTTNKMQTGKKRIYQVGSMKVIYDTNRASLLIVCKTSELFVSSHFGGKSPPNPLGIQFHAHFHPLKIKSAMTLNYKLLQMVIRIGSPSSKAAVAYKIDGEKQPPLLLH